MFRILSLVVAPGIAALTLGNPAAQERLLAIEGVSVVPMDRERVLANQTVLVRGDRIDAIGAAGSVLVPAGAERIAGRGRIGGVVMARGGSRKRRSIGGWQSADSHEEPADTAHRAREPRRLRPTEGR